MKVISRLLRSTLFVTLILGFIMLTSMGSYLVPLGSPLGVHNGTIYIYKTASVNGTYYSINGTSGKLLASSTNCTYILEYTFNATQGNSNIVAVTGGGPSGTWYLDSTPVLKALGDGGSGNASSNTETVFDFSQIEFVPTVLYTAISRDLIQIESADACTFIFGTLTANVSSGYSILNITPTVPRQYTDAVASFHGNKVEVRQIVGTTACAGNGLEVNGVEGPNYENLYNIGSISSVATGLLLPTTGSTNYTSYNTFNIGRLHGSTYGIDNQGGNIGSNTFNIANLVSDTSSGAINSPYADRNTYNIGGISCDEGEAIIFGSTSINNLVTGGGQLAAEGWTDNGTGNRFFVPATIPIPPVSGMYFGSATTATANESLVFGDIVYMVSNGTMAKANSVNDTAMPAMYLTLTPTVAASALGDFLIQGTVTNSAWAWTTGGLLYTDNVTAGTMNQTAPSSSGNQVQILGHATSATSILWNPSPVLTAVP